MFKKKNPMLRNPLLVLFIFFISCQVDDSNTKEVYKKVEITSFSIEDNTESGVKTKTQLNIQGYNNIAFESHGVFVLHENLLVKKVEQGELKASSFETIISSGIVKGETYKVFPYTQVQNQIIHGDTLDFISNIDINIKIKDFTPKKGFVYDTISIKGENFCLSLPDSPTRFLLGESYQNVIFESDSLIKAIVSPNINKSKLEPTLKNCGVDTLIESLFIINPPFLDSISSTEAYVDDNYFIYGKNFHSQISTVWINDVETQINKQRLDIDKLEITIPEGLPSGLLDLKIKVLDTIIEKKSFYQSTSPNIIEIDKRNTGFLDTLTIKGNYLLQPNKALDVLVGGKSQRILSSSIGEVKVIIDKYFEDPSPKLVLKSGSFEIIEDITMLPPEILSVDKPNYHLANDTVTLKTKYFIAGSSGNITVGGVSLRYGNTFTNVDSEGNISLPLTDWLETDKLYSYYIFNGTGVLNINIESSYGSDNHDIGIYAPTINSINGSSFLHGEYIELTGLDFGYNRVCGVYIDDELIENPGTSAYTSYNKNIRFRIPENIPSGVHTLKVKTGGQFSNEITFNIKAITTTGLSMTSGVRELDIFTINGNNLENKYGYTLKVDGIWCDIIHASKNQVSFKLPYHTPLKQNMPVTIHYGPEVINVGSINGIEPYSRLENYQLHSQFHTSSTHFEFNGKLYFFNHYGIFQFNELNSIWETYEPSFPYGGYTNSNGNKYISTVDNKIYIPYGNNLLVYDMIQKTWETPIELSLGNDNTYILFSFVTSENEAFLFIEDQSEGYVTSFIKYNLLDHTIETPSQPNYPIRSSALGDALYYHDGKIYFDPRDQNIQVFNTANNSWEDIGFPKDIKYHYKNNLYVYNDVLYLSGGFEYASQPVFNLYAYNLNTKTWTEKTPMLFKAGKHAVWGNGDSLYFGIGFNIYYHENQEMIKYKISDDPR
ncbi:IPT/TIG domain-containing protein [Aestuariivivens insulae]|uniref:IPT/TIG domain-containing protein n=1 Tax=Aestuariivivens insulae TaxID=1621988 RepID=UPI001F574580|nr:IPT/TIG domain-containing protein [Aestuariivivens insulae]